jgi:hypothetical protein
VRGALGEAQHGVVDGAPPPRPPAPVLPARVGVVCQPHGPGARATQGESAAGERQGKRWLVAAGRSGAPTYRSCATRAPHLEARAGGERVAAHRRQRRCARRRVPRPLLRRGDAKTEEGDTASMPNWLQYGAPCGMWSSQVACSSSPAADSSSKSSSALRYATHRVTCSTQKTC